jgi:uncharacterized protein
MFVNAGTLFPVVALDVLKDDFRDPAELLRDRYRKVLAHLQVPSEEIDTELSRFDELSIGSTRNRRILGSMTDLVKGATASIDYGGGLDGIRDEALSARLADTPMKGLTIGYPRGELRERLPGLPERRWRTLNQPTHGPSRVLRDFINRPGSRDLVMRYHEMLGWMFYFLAAPGFLPPLEWMMLLLGGEAAPFYDADEADAVIGEVVNEYNRLAQDILSDVGFNFDYVAFRDDPIDNFDEWSPLHDWAMGFTLAYDFAPGVWDEMPEDAFELAGLLIAQLMFFSTKENARRYLELTDRPNADLNNMSVEMCREYAEACRLLAQMGLTFREPKEPGFPMPSGDGAVGAPPKVGRNDPCPCGSGKKYKKCCGR